MFQIKFANQFKKNYRLLVKRGFDISLLDSVINSLIIGEKLGEKYKDHSLAGQFQGFRECHIKPDWLLIYLVNEETNTITLVSTGSHSDLF